ncbi:FecR domain-containing protein [Mesorhizobium sp. ZMM04-5]|uniref:FecR domain-containing protein n=1 Tax=Mesorhizobium marinum TaxID=3228790 RepID=A0ABV3QWH1_9HYPH
MQNLGKKTIATAAALLATSVAFAQEQVGQATLIKTAVSGAGQPLSVRSPVYRDERITTSASGLGEFTFRDGTKFAVGGNSSVVIDRFVFDDSNSFNQLTLNAARGSFRWISGKSKSDAYEIVTPSGVIGVRGTRLDIFIGEAGLTSVVLLEGGARFCGVNGCQELRRRCDVVIATPDGGVSDPARVDRSVFQSMGTDSAFPFLSGRQRLTRGFYGFASGSCGLSSGSGMQRMERNGADRPERPNAPSGYLD